jgi:RNA polymerase sigma-70 factor, ECF subfamily
MIFSDEEQKTIFSPNLNACWPSRVETRLGQQIQLNAMIVNFWDIYHQYYDRVRRFIFALVKDEWAADDLIQETFIKAQKNLNQVKEAPKITSWIFKIAYNLCQDYFRSMSRSSKGDHFFNEKFEILKGPHFQKKFEQHQMGECVQIKIRRLPESYQTVLVLFDLMELTHLEIAEILDISVENVKVRLHRARRKLKTILEEECRFEFDERNVLICEPVIRKKSGTLV